MYRINIGQSISKCIIKLLNYNNLKNWHSFGPLKDIHKKGQHAEELF